MKKINSRLATHGLDWNEDNVTLRRAGHGNTMFIEDYAVVDLRLLMADSYNSLVVYKKALQIVGRSLKKHRKVVICCSAGISRSNSIAIATLVRYFDYDWESALRLVLSTVPCAAPAPIHLYQMRKLLKIPLPEGQQYLADAELYLMQKTAFGIEEFDNLLLGSQEHRSGAD